MMVHQILESFKAGTQDEVSVWMEKRGRIVLVRYVALRDEQGNYIGTAEFVQDMEMAREYFSK